MTKTISALVAAATVATALPAAMAVPQTASAQAVRVEVGPAGGWYYGGRHYHHRRWYGGRWVYEQPVIVAPAPGPAAYYYGGRRYWHRNWNCHPAGYGRRVCAYRYW